MAQLYAHFMFLQIKVIVISSLVHYIENNTWLIVPASFILAVYYMYTAIM
jgi:hypothetical protein